MPLLIQNAALVLPRRLAPRGYVLIEGDRIAAIGDGDAPQPLIANLHAPIIIDGMHKALLPGLTNAHTHLEQTFMRGYSANRTLLDWLSNVIWKMQAAMDVDDVRLAATLGLIEAMRGGATTIIDHHKVPWSAQHTDVVLEAAEKLGVRLVLARAWADMGRNAEPAENVLADLQRLFVDWHGAGAGRIQIANGPLVPWRCSPALLQRSTELARAHNAITHCHMNETQDEVAMTLRDMGMRPVEWFASLGVLGDDFHAVHGVWLSDNEIKLLAKHRAQVTHCPAANMILASGAAPVGKLRRAAVRVALATDGPASNDGQDMFEMMRLAVLLAKVSTLDAQALQPSAVLEMALAGNALAVGAQADLVLVDLNAAHIQPLSVSAGAGNLLSALVHNVRSSDVDTLIVAGRVLIQNKTLLGLDEAALLEECRARAAALAAKCNVPMTSGQ